MMYLPILTLLLMPDVDTDEFDRLERTAPLVEFVEISDSLNLEPEIVPVLIDERDEQVVKESLGKDGVFRIVTQTNTKVYRLELESFPMKTPSNTKQKELL